MNVNLFNIQSQLFTLIITTIIICVIFFAYYFLQKKQDVIKKQRKGFVLFMDYFIRSIDNLVMDVMGTQFRWFTPYAIYLLLYVGIGNMLALFGWEPPITSYTVTFSLGVVTFIGIYVAGIWCQKAKFFLRYLKNPQEILTQFAPLISITFRIFGNLTAGSTILFLFYLLTTSLTSSVPVIGYVDILGGFIAPALNIYFDIFDGLIQTYIFTLLTLAYIGIEVEHVSEKTVESKAGYIKKAIYFFRSNNKNVIDKDYDVTRTSNDYKPTHNLKEEVWQK